MAGPRVYADFHNLDDSNRLRLTCAETVADLARLGIEPREGMKLTFFMDDADDQGRPDELRVAGIVQYHEAEHCWVAAVDWSTVRHASDEQQLDGNGARARQPDLTPPPTSV